MRIATGVEAALESEIRRGGLLKCPHVAVMGCVVNGPGEARDADIALCGGKGEFLLFERGQLVGKIGEGDAVAAVLARCRAWNEK